MKLHLTLVAGLAFGLSSVAHAAVVYNEIFANATAGNLLSSSAGWQYWINSGGVRSDLTSSASNSAISNLTGRPTTDLPVNSGPTGAVANGFAFIAGVSSPLVYVTQEYQAIKVADLTSASFWLGNSYDAAGGPNAGVRVVLEIGAGNWYVSTQSNQQFIPSGGSGFATEAVQKTLTLAGSTWETLNFATGQAISVGSSVSLPGSGTITGFGVYVNTPPANVRMDNFTLNAIPEPTTWALLAGGLGVVALIRRRRQA